MYVYRVYWVCSVRLPTQAEGILRCMVFHDDSDLHQLEEHHQELEQEVPKIQ